MDKAYASEGARGASRHESGNVAAFGAADWLCLAAAPTFATMALLTSVFDGSATGMLCSAARGASALSGMVPMYLLMSAFHLAPWLRLIARRLVPYGAQKLDQRPSAPSEAITAYRPSGTSSLYHTST